MAQVKVFGTDVTFWIGEDGIRMLGEDDRVSVWSYQAWENQFGVLPKQDEVVYSPYDNCKIKVSYLDEAYERVICLKQ